MKTQRAFRRDAYLGVRMPDDDKRRLVELARRKRRDTSSLALEFLADGIKKTEIELEQETTAPARMRT